MDAYPFVLPLLTQQLCVRKAAEVAGFDAWGIHKQAVLRKQAGYSVIMCTIGSPDTPTPSAAVEAACSALRNTEQPELWNYCGALGLPALRCALAAATGAPEECLAIVPGAQAGLYTALKLLLGLQGGEVLIPTPCYSTYENTVAACGGTPVLVQPSNNDGFALRVEALCAACGPATRGVLVTTPSNPTGLQLSCETQYELGSFCAARGLWCICDETYTFLMHDGAPHLSACRVPLLAERAVVIGSLSKALLRPGWRLGWLVAPPFMMPAVEALAETQHFGLSPFLQQAAADVLSSPDAARALAEAEAARYSGRRDALLAGLAEEGGTACALPPCAGMFVMVCVAACGVSSLVFAERLLLDHGVAVLPGEAFGGGAALGHIRVALTAEEQLMRKAGRSIAACLRELARN
jgi:aspartate/methionine/tyrosine aminotransferase